MTQNRTKNFKIILAISVAFIVSFSIFFNMLAKFDSIELTDEEITFYKNIQNPTKKIFIIGSSQTQAINATHVENNLLKSLDGYEVYNLSKAGDGPDKRIYSLDLLLDSKPTMVLYGIGLRDLEKPPEGGFGTLTTQDNSNSDIENILPVPKEIFDDFLFENTGFYKLRLNFLESPKFVLLNQIRELTDDGNILLPDKKITFKKIPFMKFDNEELERITKKVDVVQVDDCGKDYNLEEYGRDKKIVALMEIINQLRDHNLKVALFTIPIHQNCIDLIDSETLDEFKLIIKKLGDNTDSSVYFLHENYKEYDLWVDSSHLTFQNSFLHSNDIADILNQELK